MKISSILSTTSNFLWQKYDGASGQQFTRPVPVRAPIRTMNFERLHVQVKRVGRDNLPVKFHHCSRRR